MLKNVVMSGKSEFEVPKSLVPPVDILRITEPRRAPLHE